jgi:hypothetical protein
VLLLYPVTLVKAASDGTEINLKQLSKQSRRIEVNRSLTLDSCSDSFSAGSIYYLGEKGPGRVTRCVFEKVSQNVAQSKFCQKILHVCHRGKSSPIICACVIFTKTTQRKQSPNLVTLVVGHPARV